jgi:hypothetical protein
MNAVRRKAGTVQKYWNTVQDERGNPRYGASVSVQQNGVNSAIYTDSAGLVPAANPLTTDSTRGYFEFYAAAGTYDLSVFGVGFSPYTITGGAILGLPSGDVTFTQSGTGAVADADLQEQGHIQGLGEGQRPHSRHAHQVRRHFGRDPDQ